MDTQKLEIFVSYYSYLENGQSTISILHCDKDWCKDKPYYISANGGVAMMWMDEAEVAEVAKICIKNKVRIDTINKH